MNVEYSSGIPLLERPGDSMECLNALNDSNNEWRQLAKDYMRPTEAVLKRLQKVQSELFKCEDRVLGVLCRGTDYLALKPKGHPVQPSPEEVIRDATEIMEIHHCNKLFLVTEDSKIAEQFSKAFGNRLIQYKKTEKQYDGVSLLSNLSWNDSQSDKVENGMIYLLRILLLAKCSCFLAGRTSGTVGVMLQEHNFDYCRFYDLGRY